MSFPEERPVLMIGEMIVDSQSRRVSPHRPLSMSPTLKKLSKINKNHPYKFQEHQLTEQVIVSFFIDKRFVID